MAAKIVPSVLPADFSRLGEDCAALETAGIDRIQWDVMDGSFVPNLTFGPDVIAACRHTVDLGFEAHLMCERPEELLPRYVDAGCQYVILHPETLRQPYHAYTTVRELGARPGIALSPGTPLAFAEPVLDVIDLILIMTVNPGFGGQAYLSAMEPKIAAARELLDRTRRDDIQIEVDGGIGPSTIAGSASAGADVFVAGSALWQYRSFTEGVSDLRRRADSARGR